MRSSFFRLWMLGLPILVASCTPQSGRTPPPTPDIPFTIEGRLYFEQSDGSPITDIGIEIADDDSTRTRGLMQRSTIPDTLGMLFIFERQETRSFWMANTPHSLDILFVNANHDIVDIAKYTRPFSPEAIESRAPSLYVVEVKAGFTDSWGISETDKVRWDAF
ncbi:MAG: DUF192 domain-containing protein [Rhodothermales bacterium]